MSLDMFYLIYAGVLGLLVWKFPQCGYFAASSLFDVAMETRSA